MNTVLFDQEESVGIITINRPQSLNSINIEVLDELKSILFKIREDRSIRVVILTGAGNKAFVAGGDVSKMAGMSVEEGFRFAQLGHEVFRLIESLPQPVIAAVNGYALGGGCELALACDIRIAAENVHFGQPEVKLGILPGFGGSQRLPRLIGKAKAAELIFTGEMISAYQAEKIGLVNRVVSNDSLLEVSKELANKIASNSFFAVELAKESINYTQNGSLSEGCTLEASLFGLCFGYFDQKEGMNAFIEKRLPNFK